jgi:hypothetical protein
MLDHARRSRRWGIPEFSEFEGARDTFNSIDFQFASLAAWRALGAVEIHLYNDICFDTAAVVARIGAQLGVAPDPAAIVKSFRRKSTIGQFSKGAALRYREMAPADQRVFLERYAALYDAFAFETANARAMADHQTGRRLRARGQLFQSWIVLQRRLRV